MTQSQPAQSPDSAGPGARILLVLAPLFGGGSMLVLTIFMFFGPLNIVDLDLGRPGALFLDAGLCMVFFIQHSGMIRWMNSRRMSKSVHHEYLAAVFSVVSGISLLVLLVFWQETAPLMTAGPIGNGLLRGVFILAVAGFWLSSRAMKGFDPFGAKAIKRLIRQKPHREIPFSAAGAYRWVRHPIYFFTLMMIWAYPNLTGDRLVFNMLFTGWIIIGTAFEELDLVAAFGDDYREYQKQVPMLVPYRIGLFFNPPDDGKDN